MEPTPHLDEIEVTISSLTRQWTYWVPRRGIDRVILDGCDLQFDATVPIKGTPRTERWRVGVRCAAPGGAQSLHQRLLDGEVERLDVAGVIVGLRVFAGEVHVSRGYAPEEVKQVAEALGRDYRHMETAADGTSVDLLVIP